MNDMPAQRSPAEQPWRHLQQGSLTARIRGEVLRVLADRQLLPGDRLPAERELANSLGVSRPSLREALQLLQSEGHVVIRHGQGIFVAEPATRKRLRESVGEFDHDLDELYAMREVLEVPAARWAAERQHRQRLRRVEEAYEELLAASSTDPIDWDKLQRLDMAFHLCIVQASGNRFLEQTQHVLHDILAEGMQTTLHIPGRMEQSRVDHERILEALLRGDAAAAGRAARSHVRGARNAALRHLADGE